MDERLWEVASKLALCDVEFLGENACGPARGAVALEPAHGAVRDYNHWTVLGALCELLPQAENRVTLSKNCIDGDGLPVATFSHSLCDNDRANIAYATKVLQEIWQAAGAQDQMKIDRYAHLVGGCRMGFHPDNSVVDSNHRVWEVPNLFVGDGSVLPKQGSANPALVIMALADRLAGLLKRKQATRAERRERSLQH